MIVRKENYEYVVFLCVFKDIFASVRDIVGGRSASYERELQKASKSHPVVLT